VRQAVDAQAVATLSAQNRVRMIYLQLQRIEELQGVFHKQALGGWTSSAPCAAKSKRYSDVIIRVAELEASRPGGWRR
jgi:hypothetical protein